MDSDCGPDRHPTSSRKRAKNLRLLLCVMALGTLLASVGSGQYLETTIVLPDSLGPLTGPYSLAWDDDPAHPRIYVGGEGSFHSGTQSARPASPRLYPVGANDSSGIIVADAITCERLARIATGPVKALCFVPAYRKLYAALSGRDSIAVIDCATNNVVSRVGVASEAPVLQYNYLNDRLYCGGSSISVLDCAADTLIHTLAVSASVIAFDSVSNRLFTGCDGPMTVIDCSSDTVVAVVSRIDSAGAICYNPTAGKVYATSGDTLFAVDVHSDSVVTALRQFELLPVLACNPATNRIYFADTNAWWLRRLDCTTDTAVHVKSIGDAPIDLACNTSRDLVYLVCGGYVQVLDGTSGQERKWVTTDGNTCGWSPALNRLIIPPGINWNMTYEGSMLITVDGSNDSLVGQFPLTLDVGGVSLDTAHNRLFFAQDGGLGGVGAVDCKRNVVMWFKNVPGPRVVCYNPRNDHLYWEFTDYDAETSSVQVYDCKRDSVIKSLPVFGTVHMMRLHVWRNRIYAEADRGLYIIDCEHDTIRSYIGWPDTDLGVTLLVPEDDRYWFFSPSYTMAVDCKGDTVITLARNLLGYVDGACASPEARKIYAGWSERPAWVVNMDDPMKVESLFTLRNAGMRFCDVPGKHKVFWCANYQYPLPGYSNIRVIDTRSDSITKMFRAPHQVSGMCLDHTGNYIYCTSYGDASVLVLDTKGDSLLDVLDLHDQGFGPPLLNRATNRVYLSQIGSPIPVIRDSMLVGVEEIVSFSPDRCLGQTVVNRSTPMRVSAACELWDASGRRAAALKPGSNDISHLAPGVYFTREGLGARGQGSGRIRKVIVLQ